MIDQALNAWGVRFDNGSVIGAAKALPRYVRCVRGGELLEVPAFQRIVAPEPTVLDTRTGAVWQGCSFGTTGEDCATGEPTRKTQPDAVAYCAGLNYAGQTGWRLPSVFELQGLADLTAKDPAISVQDFLHTQKDCTWTATMRAVSEGFFVNFNYGVASNQLSSRGAYVRCVK